MSRCLQIARSGLGLTRPNPMVGAVIVYNDTIIGEGYTSIYGGPHAEVNAIQSVKNKSLLSKATLYVTLEPCSHFGKTPPCSDLIVSHKIPHVVIGCVDDNPLVAGKGIKKLEAAGCKVTVGVMEEACKMHHKRFFTFHNKKRPYIILKWAETTNGLIAPKTKLKKAPVWITNPISRQLVHKWRAEEQAILVGTNTVVEDNPGLTVRNWTGNQPIRIVLDKHRVLSEEYTVFNDQAKTIVLEETTAKNICNALYVHQINSLIVEGGAKTIQLFIDEGLWDEARVFTGNIEFDEGTRSPVFNGRLISEALLLNDTLRIYTND